MAEEESDEMYYARKLGLLDKDGNGRKKLEEEFLRDGFGDDFLSLFDFMDEARAEDDDDEDDDSQDNEPVAALEGTGKYLPPHLRVAYEGTMNTRKQKLSLLGLLNRVSEGNLDAISTDIITQVTRDKMNPADIAYSLVGMSCDNPHITLTLQATFAAIVCALSVETAPSNNYTGAILAACVDRIKCTKNSEHSHRIISNLVRFVCILFSFGLFPLNVIESLLIYLVEYPEESMAHRVDWVLVCLRFSGRVLKDNHPQKFATLLKTIIDRFSKSSDSKQVEFAMKELNSMTESKSSFRAVDHMQSACDWLVMRGENKEKASNAWRVPKSVERVQLIYSSNNLFTNPVFPNEWINRTDGFDADEQKEEPLVEEKLSLEELAVLNRMTTEVKKNAFIALMGSVDATHALLRFDQFGLLSTTKNIPSIVRVVVHCALQEKSLNSFYTQVIQKLCTGSMDKQRNRKFSVSFKIEFSSLISGGQLANEQVPVLSQIIASYISISDGDVTLEDIIQPKRAKLAASHNDS